MWLKTYVYNPLAVVLMRRISSRSMEPFLGVICFFVTFFLIGVWHGRTSEYIVFGVLQGGGVAINKLWQLWLSHTLSRKGYKELARNAIYIAVGRGLTIFSAMAVAPWLAVWLIVWLGATAVLAMWEQLRAVLLRLRTAEGPMLTSRYALVVYATALGVTALVITIVLNQPAPGIVYKAF
jgi:hypothetical protein